MIRFYLYAILAAVVGSIAAFYLKADAGYVMISFRSWIVETSLLGFVAAAFTGLLLLYYSLRLLIAALRLPSTLRSFVQRRRSERAQDSFEAGMLRLLEGNWRRAEVELVRRASDHHAPHLNYLAAARAAQRIGAGDRRDHYLRQAALSAPELEFAALLTQAELQAERGEHAMARDTAIKLRERDPRHPYAIELLAESHHALGAWEPLLELLSRPENAAALAPARARELAMRATVELMTRAVAEARLDRLKALWDKLLPRYRSDVEPRATYVRGLARLNAHAEALALIVATLDKTWDAGLAEVYGGLHAVDPLSQLATIEQWLGQYGEKPELLVAAGQACLRNKLWGKARSYLEAVIRVQPTPTAYLELAKLCEMTQNAAEAAKLHRQGLELAAQQH